ncbi:hypothetical protein RUM43_005815 [Polyplax serrata]|uniref:C2H2-type domain-containing protein n=1 Tax=Polyplax serrata TaxID=468196 RepID=A0AAN8PA40_POLSC
MSWAQSNPGLVEEEVIYGGTEYIMPHKMENNMRYITIPEEVPMIVIESNQVSAETDAPMIIVGNDVAEQMICGEEEVETETDMSWYNNPPVAHEETVDTEPLPKKPAKREGRVAVPYLKEEALDIPLNDESYATYHPFPCDFCSRRFKKKANLMNHMVAHQTQRPHSCSICSSRFMRKCDLVNHQKIHSYVPNRENRDDIDQEVKYNYQSVRKKNAKKGKTIYNKKGTSKDKVKTSLSPQDNTSFFKPTSYVDEDVKLLLEMTNRLHEKSGSSDKVTNKDSSGEVFTGSEQKPYVCNKCGRCFSRESALVSHSQIHAEDVSYDCGKCTQSFFTLDLLRDHCSKKHNIPYTGETSDDSEERELVKGKYTGDERFGTFHCSICSISFHRLDLLKQHKRIHSKKDDGSGFYKCNTCMASFSTNEKLLSHLESSASCQRHMCLLCGEHFSDQITGQKHVQQKHSRELAPNSCTICGKFCKDKTALQKHSWIHSTEKKYSCKKLDCSKKFHSWARLRRHMLSHNGSKMVRCEECDEVFPDRRALINHRHSHFPDSTARKFICNECGKSFGSRSSQQIHNRIHTGERPYGCRYCWKAFADGGTLRKHERIHTGEKPYVCVVCPRAFNQRVVLREHIRSHHSGSVCKPGYSTPVYLCPVCGIVTANSEELAFHLVKHSDDNTIRNRNPQTGIRTYKRRRKLNSYEYDENEFDESDFYIKKESETESALSDKEQAKKPAGRKGARSKKVDTYSKFTKTFEAAMKNISSLVESKPARKAKMINTKAKANVKKSKKVITKRGRKRNTSVSAKNAAVKPRTRVMSGRRKDSFNESTSAVESTPGPATPTEEVRVRPTRPRTKNVNYDQMEEPLPDVATFPEKSKKLIRKPAVFQRKVDVKKEPSEDLLTDMKPKVKVEVSDETTASKQDNYICGICSNAFPSKADLLFHVPIHI